MKELIVKKNEEGLRIDKYLKKILAKMPLATYHKLLRKKYFEVNGSSAKGNEILSNGDHIKIFLSDNTYNSFATYKGEPSSRTGELHEPHKRTGELYEPHKRTGELYEPHRVIYEDDQIILYNKPVGLLSQGDKSGDESVNTILNNYLGTKVKNSAFIPSVVNRLDRNTSGIIIFAKEYLAAKEISKIIRDNKLEKHYLALVNGRLKKDSDVLVNLFKKDETINKSIIIEYKNGAKSGYSKVELAYKTLKKYDDYTLLDVDLITGKSHQIRAQLSYIGHPIVCDKKYMDSDLYNKNIKRFKSRNQKLSCYKIKFSNFEEEALKYLSNKEFKIDIRDFVLEDNKE